MSELSNYNEASRLKKAEERTMILFEQEEEIFRKLFVVPTLADRVELVKTSPIVKKLMDAILHEYWLCALSTRMKVDLYTTDLTCNLTSKNNRYYSANMSTMIDRHPFVSMHIRNIPRDVLFNLTTEFVDKIAITQQSLRRTEPDILHVDHDDPDMYEKVLTFTEYKFKVWESKKNGTTIVIEDLRDALSKTIPTDVFISCEIGTAMEILNMGHFKGVPVTNKSSVELLGFLRSADIGNTPFDIRNKAIADKITELNDPSYTLPYFDIGPYELAITGSCLVYGIDPKTKDITYLDSVVSKGHTSILEHIPVVFVSNLSISATNQLIRHRHTKMVPLNEDVYGTHVLGDKIPMLVRTNLRELIAITRERTCSRAQKEIRDFADTIVKLLLNSDYAFVVKYMGPKCAVKGVSCTEPCKESRSGYHDDIKISRDNV